MNGTFNSVSFFFFFFCFLGLDLKCAARIPNVNFPYFYFFKKRSIKWLLYHIILNSVPF